MVIIHAHPKVISHDNSALHVIDGVNKQWNLSKPTKNGTEKFGQINGVARL